MKMKIWKWVLEPGTTTIRMPVGSKVLTVAQQGGDLVLWATVPFLEVRKEDVTFRTVMTNEEVESVDLDAMNYIGTAQIGVVVAHVFEVKTRGAPDIGNGGKRP